MRANIGTLAEFKLFRESFGTVKSSLFKLPNECPKLVFPLLWVSLKLETASGFDQLAS